MKLKICSMAMEGVHMKTENTSRDSNNYNIITFRSKDRKKERKKERFSFVLSDSDIHNGPKQSKRCGNESFRSFLYS
jgi:hypothetical protein